jgi:hypothetical protein
VAYIDSVYYSNIFKGTVITEGEFERLVELASDVIDSIVSVDMDETDAQSDLVKKATAYEVEMLYLQGGISSAVGLADGVSVGAESLGGYSVSNTAQSGSQVIMRTKDGIPVSSLTLSLLKKAGLMCRWAYAERYRQNGEL